MKSDFDIETETLGNGLNSETLSDSGIDYVEFGLTRRQRNGRLSLRPLLDV